MGVIIKSGSSLKKISIYTLVDVAVFFITAYLAPLVKYNLADIVVFDISFFLLILFVILLVLSIRKGSIIVTDEGIYLRWLRKYYIPWSEVNNIDLKNTRLFISPFTRKLVKEYAIQIYTNNKLFEIEVPKAKEVYEKMTEKIQKIRKNNMNEN
ncbi:hypothetical protein SJAV_25340 [Sulfurisphaera javensis]|uniref:PH domain-containing protein n=1 Tax=Sulfurisphaera javensis TaxID=2049879 RepID=A0AAT9GUU2_9CREN